MPTNAKTMEGKVVKRSGDKTVAVEVVTLTTHPMYGKKMKHTKRYLTHDPENKTQVGEVVTIQEIRPLSRHKHFMVVRKKETV